jgi:hypothetical protein
MIRNAKKCKPKDRRNNKSSRAIKSSIIKGKKRKGVQRTFFSRNSPDRGSSLPFCATGLMFMSNLYT